MQWTMEYRFSNSITIKKGQKKILDMEYVLKKSEAERNKREE